MEQFDKLLKEALTEYEQEEAGAREATAPEEVPEFSPEFEARMDKLLSGKKVSRRRKPGRKLWKVAAVAAACFVVVSLTRPAQEVYAGVAESVVQVYKQFTRITGDDKDVSSYEMMAEPTYIPEGYVKDDELCVEAKNIKKLLYINNENEILEVEYSLKDEEVVYQIDDEKHTNEQIIIADVYTGMYFESTVEEVSNVLLWNNGSIWYRINCAESKEELLKIAKSIMKKMMIKV